MRRILLVIVSALVLSMLSAPAEAATRARLTDRAETLSFDVSLAKFMRVYRNDKRGADRSFDWKNYDGCSLPKWAIRASRSQMRFFRSTCLRHDFGYRNFGNGLALGPTQSTKDKIDSRWRRDMFQRCRSAKPGDPDCPAVASGWYGAVKLNGKAQTAFFAGECVSGRLCLFDDKSYEDRRVALASSVTNLRSLDFTDKTSSVINRSGRAWVLFDDRDYRDRRFCLPAGVSVRNWGWDRFKFNDKTSSVKRLAGASCPRGVPTVSSG